MGRRRIMRNYLLKLLKFSLLLGALPTLIIGLVSYVIASKDVTDKVNEGNMLLLQQNEMRVEQMLQTLQDSVTQFANSSLVRDVMNRDMTSEDFITVRRLVTEMANLRSPADIQDAYLIQFERDWVVHLSALRKLSKVKDQEEFEYYASQTKGLFWNTRMHLIKEVQRDDAAEESQGVTPAETISLVYKIPLISESERPKGMIVVRVRVDDLSNMLTQSNKLGNTYILDEQGRMFLSSAEERTQHQEINQHIVEQLATSNVESGSFLMGAGHLKSRVNFRASAYNEWTYVSVISISEVTKEARAIGLLTLTACIGILLLVMSLAYFGSQRMYRPIRHLLQLTREVEGEGTLLNEKRDEMELIQAGIQSLASSKTRLKAMIQGQADHLKEFFVLKLFTGQLSGRDIAERSELYGFPAKWKQLCVMALQIDDLGNTRYQEQDRELLLFAINNIVEELFPSDMRFSPILLGDAQVTLLVLPDQLDEDMYTFAGNQAGLIQSKVMEVLQLQVSIGLGRPFNKLMDTVKAYGESLEALRCRINLGPRMIIHYEDVASNTSADTAVYAHLKPIEEQLIQAIREIEPDKAMAVLDQYLSAILHKEGYLKERRLLLLQLMMRLLQIVQELGTPIHKVMEGERAIEHFLRLQTRVEIRSWFESQLIVPIVRMLADREERQFVSIAEQLVCMIHERYDQDLVLETIAEELHFHPVYLSRVFKKEVGVPFSEYVSNYRMKMAQDMLETTNLKISEIGEKLQYRNISAFIRAFRKMYGTTPGQYREEHDQSALIEGGKSSMKG